MTTIFFQEIYSTAFKADLIYFKPEPFSLTKWKSIFHRGEKPKPNPC